ncbi:MAG: hypothetical protein CVV12_06820 [Gammaproteobacteria bacterium HGW-Gammaproteobacteria-2]|nr:MAG: hypothetical protein CVV12_06820 [Gammaproteobacteria bacterium HGW-Gammaproteobacteria-2]
MLLLCLAAMQLRCSEVWIIATDIGSLRLVQLQSNVSTGLQPRPAMVTTLIRPVAHRVDSYR